jgi:hypothetical protein
MATHTEADAEMAEIFLNEFDTYRDELCWMDLTEGLDLLFCSGMNDKIPDVLAYMAKYAEKMGI